LKTGGWNRSCQGNWYWWERGGGGEMVKEGEYGANTVYKCMQMNNDICSNYSWNEGDEGEWWRG
jgi:hypothetical protein